MADTEYWEARLPDGASRGFLANALRRDKWGAWELLMVRGDTEYVVALLPRDTALVHEGSTNNSVSNSVFLGGWSEPKGRDA